MLVCNEIMRWSRLILDSRLLVLQFYALEVRIAYCSHFLHKCCPFRILIVLVRPARYYVSIPSRNSGRNGSVANYETNSA